MRWIVEDDVHAVGRTHSDTPTPPPNLSAIQNTTLDTSSVERHPILDICMVVRGNHFKK